jgi:hypothetical protein
MHDEKTDKVSIAQETTPPTVPTAIPILDPLDQFCDAPMLRVLLWRPGCQPSLTWLRQETNNGNIPHHRKGKRVWYLPREVQKAFLCVKPRRGPKPKAQQALAAKLAAAALAAAA